MTKTFNTGYALYGNVAEMVTVDGGALVSLKTARTIIANAAASYGSDAGGEFFTCTGTSYTAKGASVSPAISMDTLNTSWTIMAVYKEIRAGAAGNGHFWSHTTGAFFPTIGVDAATKQLGTALVAYNTPDASGTVDIVDGTQKILFLTRPAGNNSTLSLYLIDPATGTRQLIDTQPSATGDAACAINYFGGYDGQGTANNDKRHWVLLNKILSQAEMESAAATVGPGGAIGFIAPPAAATTINATPGNAAAGGPNATVTQSGSTSVLCGIGNAAAGGATAGVATYLVSDYIINNTRTGRQASQAVSYTWYPNGRVGSMAGITPVDGTGTTGADGRLVTTIPKATGILEIVKRNTSALDDEVFHQAFA